MKWTWKKLIDKAPQECEKELAQIISSCAWQFIIEHGEKHNFNLSDKEENKLRDCLFHMPDTYVSAYLSRMYGKVPEYKECMYCLYKCGEEDAYRFPLNDPDKTIDHFFVHITCISKLLLKSMGYDGRLNKLEQKRG